MAPIWFWGITAFIFGITIGSFLNVVIWRLPRGQSLAVPAHSYCPNCKVSLAAIDLVPLFSFLALGRCCRRCKKPISWRYFCVELLTGALFVALTLHLYQAPANAIAVLLFTAVLIPIFFIDLERFEIPTSLNVVALAIPLFRDAYGIVQNEPGHGLLWGWMPRTILAALVGAAIFGVVRILGWLWKGVEAMGMGDVLLARALGAMLACLVATSSSPLLLLPIWVLLSCFSGAIVGPALIFIRRRAAVRAGTYPTQEAEEEAEPEAEATSLFRQIFDVLDVTFTEDLRYFFYKFRKATGQPVQEIVEEEWEPHPNAIPFGPFLVLGFLLTVFFGQWITTAYWTWAVGNP